MRRRTKDISPWSHKAEDCEDENTYRHAQRLAKNTRYSSVNKDPIVTELNISCVGCQNKESKHIHPRISMAMLAMIVEMAVTSGLGKMMKTNRMIIIYGWVDG